ncbi:hypothetical protein CEXT_713191 [Caerostris extrusa]|uniref:Uncharacterized protein n=1 Tax=Caerostris extrusa TaxID=172846 RepID=A0AAV4TZ35_CAEEX|nr:hypothetical protein CEXT_713191 [Caerostris extrusa]
MKRILFKKVTYQLQIIRRLLLLQQSVHPHFQCPSLMMRKSNANLSRKAPFFETSSLPRILPRKDGGKLVFPMSLLSEANSSLASEKRLLRSQAQWIFNYMATCYWQKVGGESSSI